jgi:CheY-like chemotaxis protein
VVASYNQLDMSDHPQSADDRANHARDLRVARLVGFSLRDRELLRLFLRRPPRAGVSLTVVDDDNAAVDLLIGNTATIEASDALRAWGSTRPAIGIVERFERDATYYQIAQDGQMLFALAQAINRIRSGWTPPHSADAASDPEEDAQTAGSPGSHSDPDTHAPSDAPVAALQTSLSESSGTGAIAVSAALPDAASVAAAVAANKGLPWQRALDILVIDDSHFSREAISAALVKVGFAVNTAENGADGLKLAAEKLFDVALVDFEMPGMQGPEVLRKLRALGSKAPTLLIMLTSRTGAVDRLRAKFAGCDAYMTKPTRMQEFLKILRDFAVAGKLTRS